MLPKEFYIEYGRVLYAVAMADGAVQARERETLIKLVERELVPLEEATDEFGSQLAYYVEFAFEAQDEWKKDSKGTMDGFFDALTKHEILVPEPVRKVCIHILEKVAGAYGGTVEEEADLIERFKRRINAL